MGNLVSLLAHCGRGDEIIVGDNAHIFFYECGAYSSLGGIHSRQVPNQLDGTIDLADIENAIRGDNIHYPRTRVICLENTHNRRGGASLSAEYMHSVRGLADRYGLKIHLDGARVFNAAVAQGVDVQELTRDVDSVMFCLSKGLSAPVGSLVCGSAEFIREAKRQRKMVGGGGRQMGIIAAAGIYALESMVERLAEDHANGRRLAEGLASIPGISIDPEKVETDIVVFDVLPASGWTPEQVCKALDAKGVKVMPFGGDSIRAVTHYGIVAADVDAAVRAVADVMSS
jgi:threonine aldolase